ncbi:MAG: MFS transporter [Rhodoferax sp.]
MTSPSVDLKTPPRPDSTALGVRMTALERRASASLASLFGLRMLGLFLVLPVFASEAAQYPGGSDSALVGLAMGVYGLTQAVLQYAYGLSSDRWGRKPVIVFGLVVFALGSGLAALAPSVAWLAVARAVQGAGAISSAVSALLADQTRDEVRTKSMALVGGSIGLMFALSLVASPALAHWIGLRGLFELTAALALAGIAIVLWWVPPEPARHAAPESGVGATSIWRSGALLRLNFGVFVLHGVQLSMWLAVPSLLVQAGVAKAQHWHIYLPAVLGSFVVMGGSLFQLERRGYLRAVFLLSIGLIALVELFFMSLSASQGTPMLLGLLLFLFFYAFNVLEASQPSLVSRWAPVGSRGAAMGAYNTLQSLGFFAGGSLGGLVVKTWGPTQLFLGCALLMLVWLALAWPMQVPARSGAASHTGQTA